jgi:hypothetical protein
MKRVIVIALLVAGLVVSGCDIFGSKEDYYPLTVGNVWNYSGYVVLQTAGDAPPDTIQKMSLEVVASRKEKLTGGEDVVEMVNTMQVRMFFPFETTYTSVETAYVRQAGNLVLSYERRDDTQPDTTLSLPLARGKTWRINQYVVAQVLEQEDVTVPAGTYRNAWKIEQFITEGSATGQVYCWYANNIGMVKLLEQFSYGGTSYISTMELTSATIR